MRRNVKVMGEKNISSINLSTLIIQGNKYVSRIMKKKREMISTINLWDRRETNNENVILLTFWRKLMIFTSKVGRDK